MKSSIIGKKEFRSNFFSARFLIIVLIFAILITGVTYGETLSTRRERVTVNILISHFIDLEGDGVYDDMVVYYSDEWCNPIEGKEIRLYDMLSIRERRLYDQEPTSEPHGVSITDENGMALFRGIKDFVHEGDWGYSFQIGLFVEDQDKIDGIYGQRWMSSTFTDLDSYFSTGSFFSVNYATTSIFHVVEPDGSPSTNAELHVYEYLFRSDITGEELHLEEGEVDPVLKEIFHEEGYHIGEDATLLEYEGIWAISVNDEKVYLFEVMIQHRSRDDFIPVVETELVIYHGKAEIARADEYGYIEYAFPSGYHRVKIKDQYNSWNYTIHEFVEFPYDEPLDIDTVLNRMTFPMILVLPLIAIAFTFDSVSKERETNSLFFLLVKPIERWKIGVGKLMGAFSAVAIPVIAVNSVSISMMWYMLGEAPSLDLTLTFFLGTLAILVFFLALQMMLSTLTNSSVTSLLGGIGIWFILGLFYPALEDGVASLLGFEYGSYNHEVLRNRMILSNPNMIFFETMDMVYRGRFGLNLLPGITDYSLIITMLIWVVGSITLLLFVFRKWLVRV